MVDAVDQMVELLHITFGTAGVSTLAVGTLDLEGQVITFGNWCTAGGSMFTIDVHWVYTVSQKTPNTCILAEQRHKDCFNGTHNAQWLFLDITLKLSCNVM